MYKRQLLAFAIKNLFVSLLNGYPPYRNDGSKIGYFVNKFSISVEIILHSVLFCKNSFPPIWSAFEWVFIMYFRLKLFSFKILFIFRPASLSLPLSIIQTSVSFNLYRPISVSYTHLDVYKRQTKDITWFIDAFKKDPEKSSWSELNLYKQI